MTMTILSEELRVRMERPKGTVVLFNGRNWLLVDYSDGIATLRIYHAQEYTPEEWFEDCPFVK
jgi:hypothetical protein